MAKTSMGAVDAAVRNYLEAAYPGISADCIAYTVERTEAAEITITTRLVYDAGKEQPGGES